jgi:hypothetical protein
MKLKDAIIQIDQLTASCQDLQGAIMTLGRHVEPEIPKVFVDRMKKSSSLSVRLLVAALVDATRELQGLLNAEVTTR